MTAQTAAGRSADTDPRPDAWWEVLSGGQIVNVTTGIDLAAVWPQIGPHMPAEQLRRPRTSPPTPTGAAVALPLTASSSDLRRQLNAHLHCLHLHSETLTLHSVVMRRAEHTAVLLGGHGAGKSLVGLALADAGWQPVAGDAALLQIPEDGRPVRVIGGSGAFLLRPAAVRRWFPGLPLDVPASADRVDLTELHCGLAFVAQGGLHTLAVLVHVDGDPCLKQRADYHRLDAHTGTSAWYTAAGHMLDRLLDAPGRPLRELETGELGEIRVRLARRAAAVLPLSLLRGSPHSIAAALEHLTDQGA